MELVLVPLWRRPGFATACLQRLTAAASCYDGNLMFRLLLDEGYSSPVEKAAVRFAAQPDVFAEVTVRNKRYGRGNSHSIMTALADASTGEWDLVHIVEEDIFVSDGYFGFHHQAHRVTGPDVFAVSACRNQNEVTPDPDDPSGVVKYLPPEEKIPASHWQTVWRHGSYQSLGVSLPMESVRAVVPHVTSRYFFDPVGYCRRYFPGSQIPAGHAEQDGVLNRIRERAGLRTAYPVVPRAYHAGFTGYNRPGAAQLTGTPQEQAKALLGYSSAHLNSMASREFRDHEVAPLHTTAPVRHVL